MANNYTQFSVGWKLPQEAADDFINIICNVRDGLEGMPQWFIDRNDLRVMTEYEVQDNFDIGDVNLEYKNGYLYVWNDGYGGAESCADILCDILDHYDIDGDYLLQMAFTCDKPRTDEFSGGIILINKIGVEYGGLLDLVPVLKRRQSRHAKNAENE